MLKLRGWRFMFYPADMVEVFRPDAADNYMGEFLGAWNLPDKVECFFDEEFANHGS